MLISVMVKQDIFDRTFFQSLPELYILVSMQRKRLLSNMIGGNQASQKF
jgi:hypothetical protein